MLTACTCSCFSIPRRKESWCTLCAQYAAGLQAEEDAAAALERVAQV